MHPLETYLAEIASLRGAMKETSGYTTEEVGQASRLSGNGHLAQVAVERGRDALHEDRRDACPTANELLGRPLTPDEARKVTHMARRLAALILLQPELDRNYQAVKAAPLALEVAD